VTRKISFPWPCDIGLMKFFFLSSCMIHISKYLHSIFIWDWFLSWLGHLNWYVFILAEFEKYFLEALWLKFNRLDMISHSISLLFQKSDVTYGLGLTDWFSLVLSWYGLILNFSWSSPVRCLHLDLAGGCYIMMFFSLLYF